MKNLSKLSTVMLFNTTIYTLVFPFITILINAIIHLVTGVNMFNIAFNWSSIWSLILVYLIFYVIFYLIMLFIVLLGDLTDKAWPLLVGAISLLIIGYFILKFSFNLMGISYLNHWTMIVWYLLIVLCSRRDTSK